MKRILINATHEEELRIAVANGQYLEDLIIESTTREQKQSNIYKGRVTRIEPSLEAAFIDYGEGRHGFLPLKEIARSCFKESYHEGNRRLAINEVIEKDQEFIVQIEKEERGTKGAALSTFITLPGCYLVLMPNNPRAGGISRRIDDEERDQLQDVLSHLRVPDGMGVIIRTAGSGRSTEELQWDLDILLRQWEAIQQVTEGREAPFLIYQESNAVIRTIRDYLRKDIEEVLIDSQTVYDEVLNHMKLIRPDFVNRLKLSTEDTPLFTRFQVESQIESVFQREVRLPSGGSIVIDHTEALVSVDINSAKATKGGDIEETALTTNLESADEIARQLRLRDIGGLIVIDFIDMSSIRNQREVEERLKRALSVDRARVQIGRISRFGLLEMSRQRLRPSLGESSGITCPRCSGQGRIRGIESLGLSIVRLIEEEALKDNTAQVRAILPIEIATYILNEKRQTIIEIEKRQQVAVVIVANPHLTTPHYHVERIRTSDGEGTEEKTPSYKISVEMEAEQEQAIAAAPPPKVAQEPALKSFITQEAITPPAPPAGGSRQGLLKRLFTYLFDKEETDTTTTSTERKPFRPGGNRRPMRSNTNRRGGRFNQNQRGRGGRRGSQGRPYESRSFERSGEGDNRSRDRRETTGESRDNRGSRWSRDSRDHHREHHETRPRGEGHEHRTHDHHEHRPQTEPREIGDYRTRDDSVSAHQEQQREFYKQQQRQEQPAGEPRYQQTTREELTNQIAATGTDTDTGTSTGTTTTTTSTVGVSSSSGRMRFHPGQSRRRYEPSKKGSPMRRGNLDHFPSATENSTEATKQSSGDDEESTGNK